MADDVIEIRDLKVHAVVGVHPWERERPRDVLLTLRLTADLERAARRDDLAGGVDYETLAAAVSEHVERAAPRTLESLAAGVAGLCLATPGVRRVWVRVEKPGALPRARTVAVELERTAP